MKNVALIIMFSTLSLSVFAQTYTGQDEQGRDCSITVVSRSVEGMKVKWEGINNGSTASEELSNPLSRTLNLKKIDDVLYQYRKYALPIGDFAIFQTDFDFVERESGMFFTYSKINALTGHHDFIRCDIEN